MFLASDLTALLPHTTSVTSLEPGELAVVNPEGCDVMTLGGEAVDSDRLTVTVNPVSAAKGGYKHFMLKEIMEQPEAAVSVLRGRLSFDPEQVELDLPFTDKEIAGWRAIRRATRADARYRGERRGVPLS